MEDTRSLTIQNQPRAEEEEESAPPGTVRVPVSWSWPSDFFRV